MELKITECILKGEEWEGVKKEVPQATKEDYEVAVEELFYELVDVNLLLHYTSKECAEKIREEGLKRTTGPTKPGIYAYRNNYEGRSSLVDMIGMRDLGELVDIVDTRITTKDKYLIIFEYEGKNIEFCDISNMLVIDEDLIPPEHIKAITKVDTLLYTLINLPRLECELEVVTTLLVEDKIKALTPFIDIKYIDYLENKDHYPSWDVYLRERKMWKDEDFETLYNTLERRYFS